eukprot:2527400-Alexandrium_andersonii.AAC.1
MSDSPMRLLTAGQVATAALTRPQWTRSRGSGSESPPCVSGRWAALMCHQLQPLKSMMVAAV